MQFFENTEFVEEQMEISPSVSRWLYKSLTIHDFYPSTLINYEITNIYPS